MQRADDLKHSFKHSLQIYKLDELDIDLLPSIESNREDPT